MYMKQQANELQMIFGDTALISASWLTLTLGKGLTFPLASVPNHDTNRA